MAQEEDDTLHATAKMGPVPENFPGHNIPSVYVNQYYVVINSETTRLVLGEQIFDERPANFHFAVTISNGVAKDMAEAILRLIEQEKVKAIME